MCAARAGLRETVAPPPRLRCGCWGSLHLPRLDEVREIVLKQPQRLRMKSWHSGNWTPAHTPEEEHACGSAHCIAGWLQALSPDAEIRKMNPQVAGEQLAPASSYMFYVSDARALAWLTDRGYAKIEAIVKP